MRYQAIFDLAPARNRKRESDVMLKVLELAIARINALPEDRQRAAAEALDHIAP
jgi:hypothetical protein